MEDERSVATEGEQKTQADNHPKKNEIKLSQTQTGKTKVNAAKDLNEPPRKERR